MYKPLSLRQVSFARLLCLTSLAAAACERPSEDVEVRSAAVTAPTNPMQFEAASDWHVTQGEAKSLAITTVHTSGAGALGVTMPSGYTRIDSKPLASTNAQLATIALGAKVSLDFLLPVAQLNPLWFGAVQMYISAPSRNVYNAYLGQVELTGIRTGIFTTLHFSIPDSAATALKGATYSDLVFGIAINVPVNSTGVYILDNLRLKGGKLPPAPTNASQIQPGSSILLEASRTYGPTVSAPASQTFLAGVIQIPQSFHVLQGNAGTGAATFEFKIGTATPVACQYPVAPGSGGTGYAFASCANGARAGDLVPADFVRLTVGNGNPAAGKTKIKAQIALNPVGDELPTGLPPIPTYFGTTGAEIQAALDAFVQQQRNWQINDAELVKLPTPAIPVGFPVTRNGTVIFSPPADNDPPFAISSRLTGSDMADAGWHVTGKVEAPVDAAGNRDTHFALDIGADVWLLTINANDIVGVSGTIDTHTPAFDGHTVPPSTGTATFCYRYFGFGQACAGPFNGTAGLNQHIIDISPTVTFFTLNYWVFSVSSSANIHVKADLTGGFTPNGGFAIAIDPQLSLGLHLEGGLSVGVFLGGGVFADVTLIGIDVPITASADTSLNAAPSACKIHVSETLSAKATISSGGGAIGYYIQGGLCCGCFIDICWRDEGNLYSWPGASTTFDVLPASPLANQDIPLPTVLCTPTGNADGGITYPSSGEGFNANDVSYIEADFSRTFVDTTNIDPGGFNIVVPTPFPCGEYVFSSTDPSDVISVIPGGPTTGQFCFAQIKYGNAGLRTISAIATDAQLGTGTGSVQVSVTGDPATDPTVTIATPAPFTAAGSGCISLPASGTATDPNGLDVALVWFSGDSLDNQVGTGPTTSLPSTASFVRLVGTNTAGQKALDEFPISSSCVK